MFDFSEMILKRGYDPDSCRLVRHDRTGLQYWMKGRDAFGAFASTQFLARSPYRKTKLAFQFVPGPVLSDGGHSALFVGAHRILDRWTWDGQRRPRLTHPSWCESPDRLDIEAYDLEWLRDWEDLSERVLVRWGSSASTRAWSQWAIRQPKEILELRRQAEERSFPGFSNFLEALENILILPKIWVDVLKSVSGVYLLACPDTGELYVGSAYGEGGFWGRWSQYAADGHGGNVKLQARGKRNYMISILEVASPAMSASDIVERENSWKRKLGSRAHGLNAN